MWAALHCRWYLIRLFHCPRCLQHLALAPSVSYTPISPDKLNQAYLVQSFLNLIWKNSWCLRLCWMNYDTKKKKKSTRTCQGKKRAWGHVWPVKVLMSWVERDTNPWLIMTSQKSFPSLVLFFLVIWNGTKLRS